MNSARKVKQYLPALIWYLQRRGRGNRCVVIAVRSREICGVDRRCGLALYRLMTAPAAQGLARRHKRGVYLRERSALDKVLTMLRGQI
jgi:hypothetical protein